MIVFSHHMAVRPTIEALHAHFLAVLPRIETHARIYFRNLSCPHHKEEAVQETVALAWQWYRRLGREGQRRRAVRQRAGPLCRASRARRPQVDRSGKGQGRFEPARPAAAWLHRGVVAGIDLYLI